MRIVVAEDYKIFRQSLISLLEREGIEVAGEAADGSEAVRLALELQPDIVLLDFRLPVVDGIEVAQRIRTECPHTRVVVVTEYEDDSHVLQALRAGVRGYVLKSQTAAELVTTLGQVAQGALYLSPRVSELMADADWADHSSTNLPLSERELQVLRMVAESKTTQQIAAALGVTPKTIDSHRTRIMHKLGVRGIAGLVRYAIRRGVIEC